MPSKSYNLESLMISVSGVRGRLRDGFGLEEILLFSNAFASMMPGSSVVVGRDSRPSGPYLQKLLTGALLSRDCAVLDLGIVPTPTVKAGVHLAKAHGGVMISASHNPIEWNAFKFIAKKGFFFSKLENQILLEKIQSQNFAPLSLLPKGKEVFSRDLVDLHIQSVLKNVDVPKIRKKKFKVFLDAVNGAGSLVVPELLSRLGCRVILHHTEPNGLFPRPPEPTLENLKSTSQAIRKTDADVGFALDPDADRLVLLSSKKGAIAEEYTLPLALQNKARSSKRNAKVVINLSTSFLNEHVGSLYGFQVLRSAVGEANVVQEMLDSKAIFGGEGNGGVIDPKVPSFGRDSLSGIAHILDLMAATGQSLENLLAHLPELHMKKQSYPLSQPEALQTIQSKLKEEFSQAQVSEKDGLWLSEGSTWVHVRPSNTEPIFRVIAEAKTKQDLEETLKRVQKCAE